MPQGDRTGPRGQGSMTGRGMGYCAGFNVLGFMNGFGFRRGFGSRERIMPIQQQMVQQLPIQQVQPQVITEKQEKQYLERELELVKQEMKDIEEHLKELK